ncbi:hypothetical protein CCUS01_06887 [Colletotrichum cuscutae]|uniref:Uncharacterized protein n=1 Tax=Colletotrichum cuscutae TaxID=1209917 RepID=A0AAI9V1X9_9PEZI|nr:hypothetical protein CCUS01_06887 [Colletotrichum cuscutae]
MTGWQALGALRRKWKAAGRSVETWRELPRSSGLKTLPSFDVPVIRLKAKQVWRYQTRYLLRDRIQSWLCPDFPHDTAFLHRLLERQAQNFLIREGGRYQRNNGNVPRDFTDSMQANQIRVTGWYISERIKLHGPVEATQPVLPIDPRAARLCNMEPAGLMFRTLGWKWTLQVRSTATVHRLAGVVNISPQARAGQKGGGTGMILAALWRLGSIVEMLRCARISMSTDRVICQAVKFQTEPLLCFPDAPTTLATKVGVCSSIDSKPEEQSGGMGMMKARRAPPKQSRTVGTDTVGSRFNGWPGVDPGSAQWQWWLIGSCRFLGWNLVTVLGLDGGETPPLLLPMVESPLIDRGTRTRFGFQARNVLGEVTAKVEKADAGNNNWNFEMECKARPLISSARLLGSFSNVQYSIPAILLLQYSVGWTERFDLAARGHLSFDGKPGIGEQVQLLSHAKSLERTFEERLEGVVRCIPCHAINGPWERKVPEVKNFLTLSFPCREVSAGPIGADLL